VLQASSRWRWRDASDVDRASQACRSDHDDQPLEPLIVFCVDSGIARSLAISDSPALYDPPVEAMAKQLPGMMARAVAMHPRLM
jgi:hypothetical protein